MPRKSVMGNTHTNTNCRPEIIPFVRQLVHLQETLIGQALHFNQVRNLGCGGNLRKSSRLRIARFSLGMFTPEARHSGRAVLPGAGPAPESRGARLIAVNKSKDQTGGLRKSAPIHMHPARARASPQAFLNKTRQVLLPFTVRINSRGRHCRASGSKCARLRTIGRSDYRG